jgi:Ca-activated chloride channel family protein
VELPFSPDRALADGLIAAYLNEFRTPIASTFVLDTSGSMQGGGRRQQLVQAMHYIAGADASLTGRIAKLTNREKVWLQPFSDMPYQPHRLRGAGQRTGGQGRAGAGRQPTPSRRCWPTCATTPRPADEGGTALYDACTNRCEHMLAERKKNPRYQYSVVAFTDGENNKGRNLEQFKRDYAACPRT